MNGKERGSALICEHGDCGVDPRFLDVQVAARGDLYVKVGMPHEMPRVTKALLAADPEAVVGSRILLSSIKSEVPECVDFSELAWLYDIGYRTMLLCDELCLKGELLTRAVNAFDAFKRDYV